VVSRRDCDALRDTQRYPRSLVVELVPRSEYGAGAWELRNQLDVSHVISEKIGNRCSGAIGEEGATVGSKGVNVLMEGVDDDKEKEGGDRGAFFFFFFFFDQEALTKCRTLSKAKTRPQMLRGKW
jgi:hypothetical protein